MTEPVIQLVGSSVVVGTDAQEAKILRQAYLDVQELVSLPGGQFEKGTLDTYEQARPTRRMLIVALRGLSQYDAQDSLSKLQQRFGPQANCRLSFGTGQCAAHLELYIPLAPYRAPEPHQQDPPTWLDQALSLWNLLRLLLLLVVLSLALYVHSVVPVGTKYRVFRRVLCSVWPWC